MRENNLQYFFLLSVVLHLLLIFLTVIVLKQEKKIQFLPINVVNYLPKNININPKTNFFGSKNSTSIKSDNTFKLTEPSLNQPPTSNLKKKDSDINIGDIKLAQKKKKFSPTNINLENIKPAKSSTLSNTSLKATLNKPDEPSTGQNIDADKTTASTGSNDASEGDITLDDYIDPTVSDQIQYKKDRALYAKYLKNLINKNWRILKINEKSFDVLYRVIIKPPGTLYKIQKLKGTENILLQNSIEQSIKVSAPFKPLPKSFPPKKNYSIILRFSPNELK